MSTSQAKGKAYYAAQGASDATNGDETNKPKIPGTWQYQAYTHAWESKHDALAFTQQVTTPTKKRGKTAIASVTPATGHKADAIRAKTEALCANLAKRRKSFHSISQARLTRCA